MKPISKPTLILVLGSFLLAGIARATDRAQLFSVVPQSDPAYTNLNVLEKDGLLSPGDSKGPLTRFEMAERIFKAETKYKEIVVAQADMDLPPPPPDAGGTPLPPGDNGAPAAGGSETLAPAGSEEPIWKDPKKVEEAEKNLKTLQEAYDFELKLVKDQKEDLTSKLSKAESDQFDLWKSVKGITEYPSISVHGIGRAFGMSQNLFGVLPVTPEQATSGNAYLHLEATGSVSKELRWKGVFEIKNQLLPLAGTNSTNIGDTIQSRWISADFNPPYMSANLGDFFESYTPLTLWNRNSLDLFYTPEPIARWDSEAKYLNFMDQQPSWPFRGLRLGTALGWPDSNLLESAQASAFVHMIRQGFNDAGGGWYIGPNMFTDLIIAGKGEIKTKKWYTGGTSWQVTADTYGVILDEPLDSTQPGSPYGKFNTATWAHQYLIGSFAPTLRIGVGNDVYFGAQYEGAFSNYQDDKNNFNTVISDFALDAGPFMQFGDSKITLTYLNVGPNFYSPLAQVRDDQSVTFSGAGVMGFPSVYSGPHLLNFTPQNQFFLTQVPRAGAIFSFYDRTLDNTFPYGMATPNREGFGGNIDVETLEKKSLKIRAAAYFLDEISGNLVVNSGGTGYTGLDTTPGGQVPKRNFTYLNFGPSFDIGPSAGLSTPLEIGTDVRFEETSSVAGTLDSLLALGGVRVGLFPGWEVSSSFSARSFSGSEMGYRGSPIARGIYLFDNSDLGLYSVVNLNGNVEQYILSTTIDTERNAKLHFDYSFEWGNQEPFVGALPGTMNSQFTELSYEIIF